MWDEWEDDGELAGWDDDALDEAAWNELDADLPRALRRRVADKAVQPSHQAGFEILGRMLTRPRQAGRMQRVLGPEQGIQIGRRQLAHPDNHHPRFGRADGTYSSRSGGHGISLEVERSRPAADAELRKHLAAMQTALGRPPAPDVMTGRRPARARRITAGDIRRSATLVVEVDPNDARRIRRVRQQTYDVIRRSGSQQATVTARVRTTYQAAPHQRGITIDEAQRRDLLDVIRPNPRARPQPRRLVRRGGVRRFDAALDLTPFDAWIDELDSELDVAG